MAELKTKPTQASPKAFLAAIADETQRRDAQQLATIMQSITGAPPKLWGTSIVGFGERRYQYASGREGDWFMLGFSPRKDAISIYSTCDIASFGAHLKKLGKHKTGKGCLYVKRLADVDVGVLTDLLKRAAQAPA